MDLRTALLGDWNQLVRDPVDLLRVALFAGALGFLLAGDGGGAAVLGALGVATLLARVVDLPRPYDAGFVAAMSLEGWGEAFGLFDTISWFDKVVHVCVPLLTAPVVYVGLARLQVLPDPSDDTRGRHYLGIAVVTVALGLTVGALWEMVEWGADQLVGSNLSKSDTDTVTDLMADGAGSLVGAALLVVWARFGWGSVRRLPAPVAQHALGQQRDDRSAARR